MAPPFWGLEECAGYREAARISRASARPLPGGTATALPGHSLDGFGCATAARWPITIACRSVDHMRLDCAHFLPNSKSESMLVNLKSREPP